MIELLAPAGNREKLETAINFGADAVYLAGKAFGLRAFCDNFTDSELVDAVKFCHARGKKAYVTLNIYAYDDDFPAITEYARFLNEIGVDAVIVSDAGIIACLREKVPDLAIHLSTQANATNGEAAKFWAKQGVERIVLAREVSLNNIKRIRNALPPNVELEAFVHGAMCVAYSGRCLLSGVTTGRSGNRGECAQSCRWEYAIMEKTREGEYFPVSEDGRGTYILNSKDLNMLAHIKELVEAGVTSFKIEGRAKTAYYLATVTNAYRRAIDLYLKSPENFAVPESLLCEPYKTSHRKFNTGFYFGAAEQYCESAKPTQTYEMCALVKSSGGAEAVIEQRNRFKEGDELEILSPSASFGKVFRVSEMFSESGERVSDAKLVQQSLVIKTPFPLFAGDILRKKS
ncbi:peptidase U32 family protein [Pumilibacter muris]|uniref:peptidase U32 family protein n=1 Tax=Pumilibacter muris TaxID=2941510 RepID=UPI00203B9958|nr:U32 family peptidase [Pumilibacter muris]